MVALTEEKKPSAYGKSKRLAHNASFNFVDNLPENEKFEIVSIHPGFIVGPNNKKVTFTSGEVIRKVMMKEWAKLPRLSMGMVDVREVA